MKTKTDNQIDELEYQLQELKQKVAELRRERPREEVEDYQLLDSEGRKASLSSLFGNQSKLILVHNMGRDCSYCTMWADGFNGLLPHLENRAAFVLTSPDKPEAQKEFVQSRGWKFPVYSAAGTSFIAAVPREKRTTRMIVEIQPVIMVLVIGNAPMPATGSAGS